MEDIEYTPSEDLSVLKNPFSKSKITSMHTFMWYLDTSNPTIMGKVGFRNGETTGEQEFKADSFGELTSKMNIFIKGLS